MIYFLPLLETSLQLKENKLMTIWISAKEQGRESMEE